MIIGTKQRAYLYYISEKENNISQQIMEEKTRRERKKEKEKEGKEGRKKERNKR